MSPSPLLVVAALALAGAAPLQAQDAAPERDRGVRALEAASARYASISTICADFVQDLENPLLGENRTSRGHLCQRRPNLFRMDFSDPDGDEIVADGTHFWVFYRSLNPDQVLRFPVDPSRGGMDFFREFLSSPTDKYVVRTEGEDTVDGFATLRLALTPRNPRGLTSARVWVDPAGRLIRKIEVTDENGLLRRVTLSNLAVDPDLAAGHFRFTVPPGVTVVSNE